MKVLPFLILCLTTVAFADDFKTIKGKEYKNVTVTRVEPDGIVLKTKSGIAKVYFIELPKDAQERFGYDVQRRKQQQTPLVTPAVVSSAIAVPHVDCAR